MSRLKSPYASERGSITPVVAAFVALAMMLGLLVVDMGLFVAARAQAQDAADAAALAAVQESFGFFSTGEGAEAAARRLAFENGGSLESIEVAAGGERVEVRVETPVGTLLLGKVGIAPGSVSATAAAEVDIEALLSSGSVWFPGLLDGVDIRSLIRGARDKGAASTLVTLLALEHLGKPYRWGAEGPDSFDCSGLVCYVYSQVGISLPRVTFSQVHCGRAVAPGELAPGDLVFFRHNAHVGIYVGGGYYVHAPRTGEVVKVSSLSARSDLSACRRII